MALIKKKRNEIPDDAILLTETEALKYQVKLLRDWPNYWDVFAFRNGGIMLSVAGALTGIYLNNHYRVKLRLLGRGKLSTYLPICVIPSLLAYATHMQLVIPEIILNKSCPVCIDLRASALQAALGCVFPALLAPISSFSLAHKYATYDIPYIHKEPMKVFQLYMKLSRPISNILFGIFIGHALLGSLITYGEARSISKVNMELEKLEHDLNEKLQMY